MISITPKRRGYFFAIWPFGVLTWLVLSNTVDVPYLDQWESFVPVIERYYSSQLTLHDLWSQGNGEARVFFPRLVMIALAGLTNWNIIAETCVNLILMLLCLLFLLKEIRGASPPPGREPIVLFNGFALLLFSLTQWENWTWGWQMTTSMNLLAGMAALSLLSRTPRPSSVMTAVAAGVVATYSFAAGLSLWIIGAILLIIAVRETPRARPFLGFWLVMSAMVISTYFLEYHKVEKHPSLLVAIHHPIVFLQYVLIFLGSPMAYPHPILSLVVGAFGAGLFLWFMRSALAERPIQVSSRFFLSLGLYAIMNAVVAGIGRVGFGANQACSSRYIVFGQLLWVANFYFVWRILQGGAHPRFQRMGLKFLCLALVPLFIAGNHTGYLLMKYRTRLLQAAVLEIRSGKLDGPASSQVFPPTNVRTAREWIGVLRHRHLSLFWDAPNQP